MINQSELRKGLYIIYNGQPYLVLESNRLKMQQRRPVMQTKMRNLLNGKAIEHNFQQADVLEEADVRKTSVQFIYENRGQYWFHHIGKASERFMLGEDIIGDSKRFLKPNITVDAMLFNDQVINIDLPVKMEFVVKQAPPGIKGNTAQGGTKPVTLDNGAVINVPLFIEEGDVIRINTQTGEYVERAEKK